MNIIKLLFISLTIFTRGENKYFARAIDNTEWDGGLEIQTNVNETEYISAVCYYFKILCPNGYRKRLKY